MKVLYVIFICVLYSCMQNVEPDNKINVGAAMNALGKITAQTISSNVRYVALETNDSSLVGEMPDMRVCSDMTYIPNKFTGRSIKKFQALIYGRYKYGML